MPSLVGNKPNQVPTNGDLGTLAFQDSNAVQITGGIIDVNAGSATVASLGASGDENTGLFFPAADTIAATTGGTERLRIDSSGRVGIGTTSPAHALDIAGSGMTLSRIRGGTSAGQGAGYFVVNSTGTASLLALADDSTINGGTPEVNMSIFSTRPLLFYTNSAERMRIDSSGNVGIGTSSPSARLHVAGNESVLDDGTNGRIVFSANNASVNLISSATTGFAAYRPLSYRATEHRFLSDGSTERMRITSGGTVLVGTTDVNNNSGVGIKLQNNSSVNPAICTVANTSSGTDTLFVAFNTNATNNGYRFYVKADGGIANFSGNNINLSDERTKTNIEFSGTYLNKICAIPVKLFNYKDEPSGEQKTLGVLAQDVEAVAPELVNNDGFGETAEGEEPLKSIYTTDMMFAMMKAIQEQQAMIEELKTRIETLESK